MRGWALLAAVLGSAALASPAAAAPEDLPLRLPDVGPGYIVNEHDCGLDLTGEESTPPALDRVLEVPGCFAEFTRVWVRPGRPRGAGSVDSLVWSFPDVAGAAAAFAETRTLTAYAWGLRRGSLEAMAAPPLGDAAVAYRTDDALAISRTGHGAAVLWRSGTVLSLVLAGSRHARVAEASARALAVAQHARLVTPTPLGPADYDDREVALDDPELGVPVVWLGRQAQPGVGLPPLILTESHGPGGPRGLAASLEYGALTLDLWRPRAFARFARTRVGRLVGRQRCARVERVAVPGGRATLTGGFQRQPRRCGSRPRDVWFADVRLGDVVVSVNRPVCVLCLDGGGPYASPAALRAVIAALRPR